MLLARSEQVTPFSFILAALACPGVDREKAANILDQWFTRDGFPSQPGGEETFLLDDVTKSLL